MQENGISVREAGRWLGVAAILALFVAAMTLHPALSRFNLDRYGDMVENYAWGITWQWGYYKHPPLFGWLTALWFGILPRSDWAYFLFAALNSGVALLLLWRIALRYGDAAFALLAMLCAMVIPPFSFHAVTYNANSAMTPIWAAVFLFYLRGLERRRMADAVLLGLLAAAAMLTKYHSAVLLAALLIHAAVDRQARPVLLSRFGLVVLAVFLIAMAGHMLWLFSNGFLPVGYAASQAEKGSVIHHLLSTLEFPLGILFFSSPALLIAVLMRSRGDGYPPLVTDGPARLTSSVEGRALLAFAILPTVLTIILGGALGAGFNSLWGLPFFIPVMIIIALLPPPDLTRRNWRRAYVAVSIVLFVIIAVAPIVAVLTQNQGITYALAPVRSVTQEVDGLWEKYAKGAPGPVVAGEAIFANGATFYSRFNPVALEADSLELSKGFLDKEQLEKRGMIAICRDETCEAAAKAILPAGAIRQNIELPSLAGGQARWFFTIWLAPPRPAS